MTIVSGVYKLQPDTTSPYRPLLLKDVSDGGLEFSQMFKAEPLREVWKPVRARVVDDPRAELADFRELGLVPAFSAAAIDVLGAIIGPYGEILPVDCEVPYFVFNVLALSDALDWDTSELSRYSSGGLMRIKRPVFRKSLLSEPIFKIRDGINNQVYVTTEFTQCVIERGLSGFDFSSPCPVT